MAPVVEEADERGLEVGGRRAAAGLGLQLGRRAGEQQLAVGEHEDAVGVALGLADVDAAVRRALEDTGLAERAGDELGTLSGGNRQRVNIAVGLLADPPVLLLDEPSSALDPRHRQRVWAFLDRKAADGTTIVFATHDLAEAARHADRVLVLADGELLFTGTPGTLHETVGTGGDFEAAFVSFLQARGH